MGKVEGDSPSPSIDQGPEEAIGAGRGCAPDNAVQAQEGRLEWLFLHTYMEYHPHVLSGCMCCLECGVVLNRVW